MCMYDWQKAICMRTRLVWGDRIADAEVASMAGTGSHYEVKVTAKYSKSE